MWPPLDQGKNCFIHKRTSDNLMRYCLAEQVLTCTCPSDHLSRYLQHISKDLEKSVLLYDNHPFVAKMIKPLFALLDLFFNGILLGQLSRTALVIDTYVTCTTRPLWSTLIT